MYYLALSCGVHHVETASYKHCWNSKVLSRIKIESGVKTEEWGDATISISLLNGGK